MHQLAVRSTGWVAFFHSVPDGVHHSPFLFAAEHCICLFYFWFVVVFLMNLTSHIFGKTFLFHC
jgi:hypothetical protein